ncbi:MAG: hypothetical protein L6R42_007156 [Xanthoria sp. 1 TBL-2021]|nr:MAG: hypothetical protein L6R42_007156 [Xanthoria sp. 1 TBL-2021]
MKHIEPCSSLSEIDIRLTVFVNSGYAHDAREDDEAAEGEDRPAQAIEFLDWEKEDESLENELDDGQGEPELDREVEDVVDVDQLPRNPAMDFETRGKA